MIDTSKIENMPDPLTKHDLTTAANAVQVQADLVHALRIQSTALFPEDVPKLSEQARKHEALVAKLRAHADTLP
jgi:hypothetical protein